MDDRLQKSGGECQSWLSWFLSCLNLSSRIAFQNQAGAFDSAATVESLLYAKFGLDILVNFNLAFYQDEVLVFERPQIFKAYLS
jgi:hypothetical protein